MNREQLAHVLRASARIAEAEDIVVIGSQAVLGSYSENVLPREATLSMEADIAFRDDREEEKADRIDGAIGEGSSFESQFGYYAQGVSISTAVLPAGWEQRVIAYDRVDARPSRAVCIEVHDLVVSKLVAGREKDIDFAISLIRARLVDADTLVERADMLQKPGAVIKRVHDAITRCARRATR